METAAAEWVVLSALHPWKDNPRKNDGEPVDKVAASIKRFGFAAPIIARKNGEIIAGHTRWKAAKKLGLERVPVRYLDLDPADAHLLAIADNRLAEEASWDEELLPKVLEELRAQEMKLTDTGFDDRELDKLMAASMGTGADAPDAEIGRADELQKKWRTALGQRWLVPSLTSKGAHHVLVCGDSGSPADVARVMGKERADALWTDPPYGVSYVGKTKDALTISNDDLKGDGLRKFLVRCFAAASAAALGEGAAVYVAHPGGPRAIDFMLAFQDAGWRIHQQLVWRKDQMVLGHSDYHYQHEPILFGYTPASGRRGRGGKGWYGDDSQVTVFDVPRPKASEEHPTMKPVELVAAMVKNSAPSGGLVYDPFCGSGTTIVAAEVTGRIGRGLEIEPKYVAVTLERLVAMGLKPKLDVQDILRGKQRETGQSRGRGATAA